MKNSKMSSIVESRVKKMSDTCKKISKSFAVGDIHAFRVEVKKLRAFLRLAQNGLPDDKKLKLPKRLKRFYKTIGLVRILQLQKENITKAIEETGDGLPGTYFDMLNMESADHIIHADALLSNKMNLKKTKNNIIEKLPKKLKRSTIKGFVQSEALLSTNLLKQLHPGDELLHQLRKHLKDILYTWPYIHKQKKILPSTFDGKNKIIRIANLLGHFHDLCIGLDLLGPDRLNRIPTESERMLLLNIKKGWRAEKENIREQVYVILKIMRPVSIEEENRQII